MKIDPAQLEATIREVLAAMLPGNDNQTEAPATQQEEQQVVDTFITVDFLAKDFVYLNM